MSDLGAESPVRIFERAREASIADVVKGQGVTLYRSGHRLRGMCPLCGASEKKKADGCFSVDPARGLFKCFACGKGGDVIALAADIRQCSPFEAAAWLLNVRFSDAAPNVRALPAPLKPGQGLTDRIASGLRTESRMAFDTPVRAYLASRAITGRIADQALRQLRYHPAAYWGVKDGLSIRMPAMIAPLRHALGVHVTYLAAGGRGKTSRAPAKKMWGAQKTEAGQPAAAWLIGPDGAGLEDLPVLVGEGIESTLSAAILLGRPCRVVAALSLGRLQGGILADAYGRVDPQSPTADPESPAFTLPDVREVYLAADRDMKAQTVTARRATGGSFELEISPDDRARLCLGLAAQAWRRAGARLVHPLAPAAGRDFNDELRARVSP